VDRRRIAELEGVLERLDDEHKQELNEIAAKLQDKTTEAATLRLDVERLRVSWLGSLVATALDSRVDGAEFDSRPPRLITYWDG